MQRAIAAGRLWLPAARSAALVDLQRAGGLAGPRLYSAATTDDADSHDDFKPKVKAAPSAGVDATIEKDISSHDVFIYMKGVPEAPMCGFSNMACAILNLYGVQYGSRNVLADPEVREGVKRFTAWPTVPQIFIKGEFVGGSDILHEMHQKGELKQALEGCAQQD
ncbi:monothiol glutaredoxin-mitochondrial-like [Micractinium conductrix]|uniref:Monothiol glutaredoxin-mitochondrial-like n=1 Tax=Micractinium conductrix TaxID=554055 RepID=A0A2P6VBB5_9CHLO|nr:monothiol glutaredoxin-mitochondrial-like [Micractinium conductrix]|eukprot:PSC71379.1 monothiol glutaredoxin-mitochondrial-like [Micractinium conductrix]